MFRLANRRAVLSLLLIGMMLAPVLTCIPGGHTSAHGCCARLGHGGVQIKNDCCGVRQPVPAVMIAGAAPSGPASADAAPLPWVVSRNAEGAVAVLALASPPRGAPPGVFQLRI